MSEQDEQLRKAVEFASQYRVSFTPEILRHLYQTVVERTLPPTATLAEHAELNGQRKLVLGFIRQTDIANSGQVNQTCAHSVIFTQQNKTEAPVEKAKRRPGRPRKNPQ